MAAHPPPRAEPPAGASHAHGEREQLWTGAEVTHWFVPASGGVWHCVTAGEPGRDAIVFLHGFPETGYAWHHQLTGLADAFYCVAIDLKGYGQSWCPPREEADYDYAFCATEYPALFDALGLERFNLVSHDRGAVIADHLCAVPGMAPRIRRYVRMQQSGNRPHSEPRPPHAFFASRPGADFFAGGPLIDLAYGLRERGDGQPSLVSVPIATPDVERMRREIGRPGVAEDMSASFASAGFDRELADRKNGLFAAMTMPVLFLQGRLDPGQQPHEYETVTREVAQGHLAFVDAGHFLHLERPDAVTAAIRAFLVRTDLPA